MVVCSRGDLLCSHELDSSKGFMSVSHWLIYEVTKTKTIGKNINYNKMNSTFSINLWVLNLVLWPESKLVLTWNPRARLSVASLGVLKNWQEPQPLQTHIESWRRRIQHILRRSNLRQKEFFRKKQKHLETRSKNKTAGAQQLLESQQAGNLADQGAGGIP